jgi:TRAP-type C4-dicarboxylate transport system permease small subunit
MRMIPGALKRWIGWMNDTAALLVIFVMLLTVGDVICRAAGTAILGTYEIVGVAGAFIIGLALPLASWNGGHVSVDLLEPYWPGTLRKVIFLCTRILVIVLFAILSYNLYKKGIHLHSTRESSYTLHIPLFYTRFGLTFCFLVQCGVLIADINRAFRREEGHE